VDQNSYFGVCFLYSNETLSMSLALRATESLRSMFITFLDLYV
jgi:hypothetical protein